MTETPYRHNVPRQTYTYGHPARLRIALQFYFETIQDPDRFPIEDSFGSAKGKLVFKLNID